MKPIAILGGTFDPVHNGHLRVAWEAAEALDAEVRLMPAHVPPHRPAPVASAAQRVDMLRSALVGQSRLTLDTRELDRAGASYTVDTLRGMRVEVGDERSLILLVGADAFGGLPTWREWHALFDLAHIAMLTRPGRTEPWPAELVAEAGPRRVRVASELRESACGKVLSLPVTPLDISASAVRALLADGREPRWLIPDALLADVEILRIYRRQ
ncbi:MAG TPA: nicotinate-nucleotide adenylyltransferase [Rudaea sp.]|jgi:nicotinate-nucleotide adenylyltransferase|uniref:nicotinate-nucleotide adenylyltransferase n=1 Tax=Rudaea sp. TaxID=2136325 RepID=UPI002F9521D6